MASPKLTEKRLGTFLSGEGVYLEFTAYPIGWKGFEIVTNIFNRNRNSKTGKNSNWRYKFTPRNKVGCNKNHHSLVSFSNSLAGVRQYSERPIPSPRTGVPKVCAAAPRDAAKRYEGVPRRSHYLKSKLLISYLNY